MKRSILCGVLALSATVACEPSSRLVIHAPAKKHAFEKGDDLVLHRVKPVDDSKLPKGFRVVRNSEEWSIAWRGAKGATAPPLPPKLNLDKHMLLWAKGEARSNATLRISRVVRNGGVVHVYVDETLPGEHCRPPEADDAPVDMVAVTQVEGQVQYHIARSPSPACGKPPEVAVGCRVKSGTAPLAEKMAASAGDAIECDATGTKAQGPTGIVDRNWFAKWPDGSAAKLTYGAGGHRVDFAIDAYGTYLLTLEAVDEEMKRGQKSVTIEVLPPKDELLVQLSWGGFDSGDDPETFPRLDAKVVDRPEKAYLEPTECVMGTPAKPLWCKLTANGIAKHFHVLTEVGTDYLASVRYIDARFEKMPFVCVTTFSLGKKIATVCDKRPRAAGELWDVGRYLGKSHVFEAKY